MSNFYIANRRKHDKNFETPEVLSPAGTLEKLKVAVQYGADAVFTVVRPMVFVAVQGTLLSNKWKKEYSSRLSMELRYM